MSRLTDQLAGKADTESVQALSDEVQQLKASIDDASSGDDTSADAVVQLDERVDALAQQVEDLRSGESDLDRMELPRQLHPV